MTCGLCGAKTHNRRRCPEKGKAPASTSNPSQPQPAQLEQAQPQPKRPRTRANATPMSQQSVVASTSMSHLDATAQPTRTGRGGRVIRGGVGSRGGSRGGGGRGAGGRDTSAGDRAGGRARGAGGRGRGRARGVGVLISHDGSAYVHVSFQLHKFIFIYQLLLFYLISNFSVFMVLIIQSIGQQGGPREVTQTGCPIGSQSSTATKI